MHSAIYRGWLEHRRWQPRRHAFRYPLFMLYLDLAELDEVFAGRWWWSTRRWAPARFDRRDHLGDPAVPLDEAVRSLVDERTGRRPAGPVRLLTHLRYWGLEVTPVSFYYCCDAEGSKVEAVVAEVNNTPWGERHCYVLQGEATGGATLQARSAKVMHVSPFHPMALDYDWRLGRPGEELQVAMFLRPSGEAAAAPVFTAWLSMRRSPVADRSLAAAFLRFPWMSAQVLAAIHWQALRLWLKRVPVHDHPAKQLSPADALDPRKTP